MSVTGAQLWDRTLGQVLLAWDWWHHRREPVRHPWHLREATIQVALVRVVTPRLGKKAVRTENGTGDDIQKASRPNPELTAMSA
jgi:hypothetical protein